MEHNFVTQPFRQVSAFIADYLSECKEALDFSLYDGMNSKRSFCQSFGKLGKEIFYEAEEDFCCSLRLLCDVRSDSGDAADRGGRALHLHELGGRLQHHVSDEAAWRSARKCAE